MEFSDCNKITVGVNCVILTSDKSESSNIRTDGRRGIQVLLLKRNMEPYKDMWSLPGSLIEEDKKIIDTINDKLFDKLNLGDCYKEQLYTYGDNPDRDPRGRVISIAYMVLAPKIKFNDIHEGKYGEIKWFWTNLDDTGNLRIFDVATGEILDNLAFDHYSILKDALLRLRNKVNYTDVAFKLMPELFTVRELQDVFETINGKQIYSFRKFLGNSIKETDFYSEVKAHRPSKLFKYTGKFK